MDKATKPVLTQLRKRDIERILAFDLNQQQAAVHMAQVGVAMALEAVPNGVMPPDSNLTIKQALNKAREAQAGYQRALERWKRFVLHGTIPDDVQIP